MVINIKNAPFRWQNNPDYVYIGRKGRGYDGYFGNPFHLKDGEKRGSTLKKYEEYLIDRLSNDTIFAERVFSLKGKILVCYCKPMKCHGDILSKYVDEL